MLKKKKKEKLSKGDSLDADLVEEAEKLNKQR